MSNIEIRTHGPLDAVVVPPGSKSITNRALLLAALADGLTTLDGVLDAEDTQIMLDALRTLGLNVFHDPLQRRVDVIGRSGLFSVDKAEIYVGNSGTTARFLTAALCFSDGDYRLYGKPRMHERPIRDLADALSQLGAHVRCENRNDCPPVLISGIRKNTAWKKTALNRDATVSGALSSQYLSALLMAAPLATEQGDVEIRLADKLVSVPYVEMTLAMIRAFGVDVSTSGDFAFFRFERNSAYKPQANYRIEPDASAAAYFFAAAAICGGSVRVPGLSRQSLQGDVAFVDCLEEMGCSVVFEKNSITVSRSPQSPLRGIAVDMNNFSDTAQTLAAVALFAEGPTEIRNIKHVRFKETDRIAALVTELRKFGAVVEERPDGLKITPPKQLSPAAVETYDDHRMAMSFAVAGLRQPGVVIKDPNCVEKTFPEFFEELGKLSTKTLPFELR